MRRLARLVVVLAAAATAMVAACFSKPGAPHATGDSGVMIDAQLVDAGMPSENMADARPIDAHPDAPSDASGEAGTCDPAHDDFSLQSIIGPCGDWATTANTGGVTKTRTNGYLDFAIGANLSSECTSQNMFKISNGASVGILTQTASLAYLKLVFPDTTPQTVTLQLTNTGSSFSLHLYCPNSDATQTPIGLSLPLYLRLTVTSGTNTVTVHAFKSSMNGNWGNQFDQCTFALTVLDKVTGEFGGSGSGGGTTNIDFDDFNTYMCPPP